MNQVSSSQSARQRYLITGAKGFIGSWIVKLLIERGDHPVVLDRDADAHRLRALLSDKQMKSFSFVAGDVTQLQDIERAVTENGVSRIIHLAALQVPPCAANPPLGAQVNVGGTLNVFETARAHPDQIRRIVYASSAAVFGPEELYGSATVGEGAPLEPMTHYGVFKQCNEGNARVYFRNHGISSTGIRPWAVYGPGRDMGMTSDPTKAIKAAVLGRPFTIRFTGGVDMQYVGDTAKIFLACADSELPGARVYTLRGAVVTVEKFIAELERLRPAARGLITAAGAPISIAFDLDDSALARDLKQVPRTPLDQGIAETIEIFERLKRENRLTSSELEV